MYFWKVDDLVADFRENKVTAKEEVKYMICWCCIASLVSWSEMTVPTQYNVFDFAGFYFSCFLSVLGVYICYKINSAGDGKDFIVRIICISIPVLIRIVVFYVPIYLCFLFIGLIELDGISITNLWNCVLSISWSIIWLWYLCKKMKAVSAQI